MATHKGFRHRIARRLAPGLHARTRLRRLRTAVTYYETPVSLRSKLAIVTIALMIMVILAAALRVHPPHVHAVFKQTPVISNPYMGVLNAQGSSLLSQELSWADCLDPSGAYVWETGADKPLLPDPPYGESKIVLLFDGTAPEAVLTAADQAGDRHGYLHAARNACVTALCEYLGEDSRYAYLQTDSELDGLPESIGGIYLLSKGADGLYRAPGAGFDSYVTSPVAGGADDLYSGHLTYLTEAAPDAELEGRLGYAIGILDAEWHNSVRAGYRLFVNLTLNNAGTAPMYHEYAFTLTLWRNNRLAVAQTQPYDLRKLLDEPERVECYIDVPYNLPAGRYSIRAAICDPATGQPAVALTLARSHSGYYEIGTVVVK